MNVEVVYSPDLRNAPFHLASAGIGGDPLIFEYGDNAYLLPLVDRSRVYDLIPIIRHIPRYEHKEFFAAGAGKLKKKEIENQKLISNASLCVYGNS